MKDSYEMKQFRKRFAMLVGAFLPVLWLLAWYCCDFDVLRACALAAAFLLFAICIYIYVHDVQKKLYGEMEKLSKLMVDVIEEKIDYREEVYKEGTTGILYTNFYKMVTVLRESRLKEGKEKEFLKDTISDISHQLKTPLASLGVFVDLLYEDKLPLETQRKEVLGEARKQLDRMEWMVLAMLKLARIEAGAIEFVKKKTDAMQVISAAVEGVHYLTQKREQEVILTCSDEGKLQERKVVWICCDGEWLTEAIINLLKNASDYSKEGSTIKIYLEENELFTRIHIQDEGVGIAEEALPHVFKRFYRADNSVNHGSVGIGLALTKSIVEGMGGSIKVRSEVGKYTCFSLTFLK